MTGRTIPEWIGKTPDSKVPPRVRARVFERAGGVCHITKRKIAAGEAWDLEHIRALADGGEHREANLAPALRASHCVKTAAENTARSIIRRKRNKHTGALEKSTHPIRSRKVNVERERRFPKPCLPPISLYVERTQ